MRCVKAGGVLLLAACATAPFPAYEPVGDAQARRALVARLVPEPAAATVVQRWIVERGGSEFFFTLYLRVSPPDTLKMAVLSDLGGTLAEASSTAGKVEVIRASRVLHDRFAAALLRDLEPLFLPAGRDRYRLVRVDGEPALYLRRFGQEALFRERPDGAVRVHLGAGGRARTVATVTGPRRPAALRLESRESGYAATIEVVSWEKP